MRPVLVGGVEVFAGRGNVFYGACLGEAVGVGEGVTGDGAADEKRGPPRAMSASRTLPLLSFIPGVACRGVDRVAVS